VWLCYARRAIFVAALAMVLGCASDKHENPQSPFTVSNPLPPLPAGPQPALPPLTAGPQPALPGPQPAGVRTTAYLADEVPAPSQLPALTPQAPNRQGPVVPPVVPPATQPAAPPAGPADPEYRVPRPARSAVEELPVPSDETATPVAVPVLPGAITLSEALAETLQSDPKLRAAVETIRQAEGDLRTSSLPPNPTVQINGDFLPVRPFTPTRPGGPPELDVIGSYPIDWYVFGKRAAAMTNAQIGVDVSNADYCDQVRQRLANTASAFYDVLEARAMLQLAQEDLANLKRVEQITIKGVKFGGSGTIEAERIRLSVLAAQNDVCTRATTLTTAKAQFRAAIGRPGRMSATDVMGSLEVGKPAEAPARGSLPLADAVALAERNRPDIISLRRQVAKARSGIEVEQTKARAQLTPALGYQYQWQEANGDPDAASYTAQLAVTVPLFDRNQGNIAKAQSTLTQSCYNLQAQLVQTEADVEQAVGEFADAEETATRIGPEQLAAARSVRDRTVEAYGLGGKTLLDVLDAERAYRDTHRTYILAQSAYWHALHRLNAAVGQQVLQ
jgi:cobalt-zinc-cadmium efflux system outer membrane protein